MSTLYKRIHSSPPPSSSAESGNILMKSPFSSHLNDTIAALLPDGTDKALKAAFYNALAFVFLIIVLMVLIAVHFILEPFIGPLVWALLFGSALHPFKRALMSIVRKRITDIKCDGTPIAVAFMLSPIYIINHIINILTVVINQYSKLLIFILIALPLSYLFFNYIAFAHYVYLWSFVVSGIETIMVILSYVTRVGNTYVIFTFVTAYLLMISFYWSDDTKPFLVTVSPIIWTILLAHIVSLLGTIGVFLSLSLFTIMILGIIKTIVKARQTQSTDHVDTAISLAVRVYTFIRNIWYYIYSLFPHYYYTNDNDGDNENGDDEIDAHIIEESDDVIQESVHSGNNNTDSIPKVSTPFASRDFYGHGLSHQTHQRQRNLRDQLKSTAYLYSLLWASLLAQLWFHPRLLYFAPLIILLITIKWFSSMITNTTLFNVMYNMHLKQYMIERRDALIHPYLRKLYYYFQIGDQIITDTIEASLNSLTSLTVIFVMFICIIFATIFISIQIYGESLQLVNLMSNLVNSTIGNNPEMIQLLPEGFHGVHGVLDELINNGYLYGRDYIKSTIHNALNIDGNLTKTTIVEKQILEVWDRAYNLWLNRNMNTTEMVPNQRPYDWNKLMMALGTLDFVLCFNILKENIVIVTSVIDSVWIVLKGNMTLLFNIITAIISSLLSGGTALLNFFLNFIIFTTALFYLLSASGEQYKPVELVNRLIPTSESHDSTLSNKFGRAVGEAINSVFEATIKMMTFYGLYTWLIHTLFEVNIVYIPMVIAATFGAVPFLGAYWASLPAVLELWLMRGETSKALLMMIAAILPSSFVDSAIYGEIKGGGHPYLTGLAIAGGVFYLGFEGALFGPILLCCLHVAFNMYGSIIQENIPEIYTKVRSRLKRVNSTLH